jgi:SWI/SNF-related matrix-associated actin-dependent regulator 1 of chromatin subfamily A
MALSQIIKKTCKVCGKVAKEQSRVDFGDTKFITLECGHCTTEEIIEQADYSSIVSSDGRSLMPYQVEGVQFAERANAKVLIADEQGLGKTVQALALLKLHGEDLLPAVVVCKTTLKTQWFHEIIRWTGGRNDGKANYLTQVINSSKERPIPHAFGIYITTYDILKVEGMFSELNVKTVIIDECQTIKNHLADRSKAVQSVARDAEHIIALSGTPIKNNAGEYFTILNLLQPTRFPEYHRFLREWCDSYQTAYGYKVGGILNTQDFREATSDFIIRRTRAEVLPDLPPLERRFYHVELNKKFNSAYRDGMKELEELMYSDDEDAMTSIIAIMTKLRRITGLSKTFECVDFVTDFMLSTDRKIVIFVHHHDVVTLLEAELNKWMKDGGYKPVLNLNATLSGDGRAEIVRKFKDEDYRVMIASTLAAGEGLNLQFCSDAIMLERQWNPANEEQAEGRFARIGQTSNITITYMIASETIDEYFTELVEQKRAIVKSTLDNESMNWDSNSLLRDLANVLVTKGKEKWRL